MSDEKLFFKQTVHVGAKRICKKYSMIYKLSLLMTSWHGGAFRLTGPLRGESISHPWIPTWIPHTRACYVTVIYTSVFQYDLIRLDFRRGFGGAFPNVWKVRINTFELVRNGNHFALDIFQLFIFQWRLLQFIQISKKWSEAFNLQDVNIFSDNGLAIWTNGDTDHC